MANQIVTQKAFPLPHVLRFLYRPFFRESEHFALVCKRFNECYKNLFEERALAVIRDYFKLTDIPGDLPDHSEDTMREFRLRVLLMCLTTVAANLRLRVFSFHDDPSVPFPHEMVAPKMEYTGLDDEERQKAQSLCRKAKVSIQSSPFSNQFSCDWLAFDAFSDEQQYSVHVKWAQVELTLPSGILLLEYEDTFEHDDSAFGPYGKAVRTVRATASTPEMRTRLQLEEDRDVVYYGFKKCHMYEHFRYYLNEPFYAQLAAELGWSEAKSASICTFLCLLLTQTFRRVYSALLPNSHSTQQISKPVTMAAVLQDIANNLKRVYPSKISESGRAIELAKVLLEQLSSSPTSEMQQLYFTNFAYSYFQQRYDSLLMAAIPSISRPGGAASSATAAPVVGPFPSPDGDPASVAAAAAASSSIYNPLLNQYLLNSYYTAPFGYAPPYYYPYGYPVDYSGGAPTPPYFNASNAEFTSTSAFASGEHDAQRGAGGGRGRGGGRGLASGGAPIVTVRGAGRRGFVGGRGGGMGAGGGFGGRYAGGRGGNNIAEGPETTPIVTVVSATEHMERGGRAGGRGFGFRGRGGRFGMGGGGGRFQGRFGQGYHQHQHQHQHFNNSNNANASSSNTANVNSDDKKEAQPATEGNGPVQQPRKTQSNDQPAPPTQAGGRGRGRQAPGSRGAPQTRPSPKGTGTGKTGAGQGTPSKAETKKDEKGVKKAEEKAETNAEAADVKKSPAKAKGKKKWRPLSDIL